MDFQKNDALVGLFVLLSLLVLVTTLVLIARGSFEEAYPLVARFTTISSIQQGTPVLLRGYRVGEVKAVRFVPEPDIHFDADLVVDSRIRLFRGTRAIITSTNLIGENYLDLDVSHVSGDTLRPGDVILGESSQAMGELMGRVNGILTGLRETVKRVDVVLGGPVSETGEAAGESAERLPLKEMGQTLGELRRLLENLNGLTAEARPELQDAGRLLNDELREARWTTATAGSLLVDNRERIGSLLVHMDQATQRLDSLLQDLHGIAADNRDELERTMVEVEKTSANVSRLTEDLAEHPWKLLFR